MVRRFIYLWLLERALTTLTVDINYITKSQIVQVTYEGRARRFAIESINGSVLDEDESLSLQLAKTTLADSPSTTAPSRPQLWTVTWDTTVSLATPSSTAKTESESTDVRSPRANGHHVYLICRLSVQNRQ